MNDIAVIMSVYNKDRFEYIRESVNSILGQSYTDFHFYISFDGPISSEIENYISTLKDKRIRLFRITKNGGLARALNYLLEIILRNPEYQLIARMDADDISLPLRFEKQRTFLLNNPDISCIGCWYYEIDESGKHLSERKLPIKHENLKKLYYIRTPFAHPSVMYRRSLIETIGFYPTNTVLMEDNVLWGKALKAELRFANIPDYLLKFREDKNFYKRRSGLKYGWNFIITRFKINKSLNFPVYAYIFSLLIGLLKMMPAFILRYINIVARRF